MTRPISLAGGHTRRVTWPTQRTGLPAAPTPRTDRAWTTAQFRAPAPTVRTGNALLGNTDAQIDRRIVTQGRAIDPMTVAYHTPRTGVQGAGLTIPRTQPVTGGTPMTAPTFRDIGNWFTPDRDAPQVSADPLAGVAARFLPTFQTPLVERPTYQAMSAENAPQAAQQDSIMQGADTAMALLDYYGGERRDAAREQAVARGMGRTGVGLALEDRVQLETDLHKADVFQGYVRAQAELNQEVEIANAQLQLSWQELSETTRRFQAQLDQDAQLANQQAHIQMSGQQSQFALGLADLSARREAINAEMRQTQQQMLRSASEFDRTFAWNKQLDQLGANLQVAAYNEGIRQFNVGQTTQRMSNDWTRQVDLWNQDLRERQFAALTAPQVGQAGQAGQAGASVPPLSDALKMLEQLQMAHPGFNLETPSGQLASTQALNEMLAMYGLSGMAPTAR